MKKLITVIILLINTFISLLVQNFSLDGKYNVSENAGSPSPKFAQI